MSSEYFPSNRDLAFFRSAEAISKLSDHRYQIGCVIVNGHKLISSGCNTHTKKHAFQAQLDKDNFSPPNYGDADSVLGLLYECFNENNPYDNEQIREDFNELYQQMNGMPLREMDQIVYPVCKLCRDHERAGFVEGIKLGIRLANEINITNDTT